MHATRLVGLLIATTAPFAIYSDLDPPVVVLSGTRNARDVMDDIDVRFCDRLEHGRVHCGILGRAQRFWEDEALRRLCLETPPIVVGWSLGGGVGVCLTALIERDGGQVRELHTFGAPAVGDAAPREPIRGGARGATRRRATRCPSCSDAVTCTWASECSSRAPRCARLGTTASRPTCAAWARRPRAAGSDG